MTIYVLGNPLMKQDSLPLKLIKDLKKSFPQIKFQVVDPNENFPPQGIRNLFILDTVKGIKKPMILKLDDFEKKEKTPLSPHDYDIHLHLLLLRKMKKVDRITIIGLPPNGNEKTLSRKLLTLFKSLLS